jgi:DNA-binding NarL/FixJ family response regulator
VLIEHLYAMFEFMWISGKSFETDNTDAAGADRDELWQVILEQLAEGVKDDAIAHRLGLSVRTCRRHIAAIMEHLGASSRFQAGVLAHRRGLLGADPRGVPQGS